MFASAGISRPLALRWVDTLRRLLVSLGRLLSAAPSLCAAMLSAMPAGGVAAAETRKQLSARFGPLLRLALLL
eukprot:6986292-Prymnesium_polylepis.1